VFVFVFPSLVSWNVFKVIKLAESRVNFPFWVLAAVSLLEMGHPIFKRGQGSLYRYLNKTLNGFPSAIFSTVVAILPAAPRLWLCSGCGGLKLQQRPGLCSTCEGRSWLPSAWSGWNQPCLEQEFGLGDLQRFLAT